jgi:hypothetical protein
MKKLFKKISLPLAIVLSFFVFALTAVPAYAATPYIVSAKITGPNTVTLVYSEPVSTSVGSYTNFTGILSGMSLIAVNGSGSNTILLTFQGTAMPSGSTGSLTITGSTVSISDDLPYPTGTINVVSGLSPVLSSVSVSSNDVDGTLAGVGNLITVTFSLNETIQTPTVVIDGHSITANGGGSGPYTATYTLQSTDSTASIPVVLNFTDYNGNTAKTTVIVDNAGQGAPIINSITSTANTTGALKIGNSITFTLTPAVPEPNATVTGSYNNVPLSWSSYNSGETYTAVYTVVAGNASQLAPLQISGVTLTDMNGDVSAPAAGTDVQETIYASAPYIAQVTPVPTPTYSSTPSYTFSSSDAGTITYSGDCSSPTTNAITGSNTVVFNELAPGTHSDCIIEVTDAAGNPGNQLIVSPFTVESGATPSSTALSVTQTQTQTSTAANSTASTVSNSGVDSYKFYNPLNVGSKGEDVTMLQKRLMAEGVYSGPITAYYGALTQTAVERFQADHGLQQLGNVGPGTRALLNSGV